MTTIILRETEAPKPAAAAIDNTVTDKLGRKLTIKEPSILQESRLVRTVGADSANAPYMHGYVMPACMVTAIDGDPVMFPYSEIQIEAQIQRLGREGMAAVMDHILETAKATTVEVSEEIKK